MSAVVVDTNVILVANEAHEGASLECVRVCIERLKLLMAQGTVAVDDGYRIVLEYQNKTQANKAKGVGDVFVKWVLTNLARTDRVHQVPITETAADEFGEFPDKKLEKQFDPPDRKFAAVAAAHPNKASILQASDCKWLDWWPPLRTAGVEIEFICPDDICEYYARKFPDRDVPELP